MKTNCFSLLKFIVIWEKSSVLFIFIFIFKINISMVDLHNLSKHTTLLKWMSLCRKRNKILKCSFSFKKHLKLTNSFLINPFHKSHWKGIQLFSINQFKSPIGAPLRVVDHVTSRSIQLLISLKTQLITEQAWNVYKFLQFSQIWIFISEK